MVTPCTVRLCVCLYMCMLQVWQVVVQSRQRLDLHGAVGTTAQVDLVVRGDRFARRARVYASPCLQDHIYFQPNSLFQLVPGAYNRVLAGYTFKSIGQRYFSSTVALLM
jgi:hypothetical protein